VEEEVDGTVTVEAEDVSSSILVSAVPMRFF
jgi:hypothetical protein